MATTIEFSSLEDLEEAVRQLDRRAPVMFSYTGAGNLTESAVLYRALEIQVNASDGRWKVQERGMQILRSAGQHYEKLDLLQDQLEFVQMDLKGGIVLKNMRFNDVRSAANEAVSSAHPSSSLTILDGITMEAQRVGRVTRALGFGSLDLDLPLLTEDDLDWLFGKDKGEGGKHPVNDSLADGLEALSLDDPKIEGAYAQVQLEGGDGINKDEQPVDKVSAFHRWALNKEEVVVGLLNSKISDIREAILEAKKTRDFI